MKRIKRIRRRWHKGASGPRSNLWSESKCSNWGSYDLLDGEACLGMNDQYLKRELQLECDYPPLQIFEAPLRDEFLRPYTVDDVENVLRMIPVRYTRYLKVYLLGGSRSRAKKTHNICFGSYTGYGYIFLHAFPTRALRLKRKTRLRADELRRLQRSGVEIIHKKHAVFLHFTETSLRHYQLYGTLLHEIGHKNDANAFGNRTKSENYAKWFTDFCVSQMPPPSSRADPIQSE